jgi:glycogen(starch) synthase
MRVLHVNAAYWPFLGGAELYLQAVSERLVRQSHSVIVVTTDAAEVEHFWADGRARIETLQATVGGVEVRRCRVAHLQPAPWAFYLLRRTATEVTRWPGTTPLLRFAGQFMPWVPDLNHTLETLPGQFDVVHGVNVSLESPLIAGWRFARRHGLPFVATPFVHVGQAGSRHVSRNYTMRHQLETLRDADAVIVQTDIEGQALAGLGVPARRIHQVGMGVDPGAVQGGDAARFRARYGLSGPIVAFIGSVTPDKGAIHLVQAIARLWAEGRPVELVLAGQPVSEFEHAFARLPADVRRRVRRIGPVIGQDKRDLLAACSLLAMPSRVDSFGIVYLEAWACGKPVIGAWAGGVPEVIHDGETGLLVHWGDVPALADAIGRLLDDPDLARRLGQAGSEQTLRQHTWDHVYDRVLAIYHAVKRKA